VPGPARATRPGRGSSQRLQVLDPIALLSGVEPEPEVAVVVRDDIGERGEAAVVAVAALAVGPQAAQWGGAVALVR